MDALLTPVFSPNPLATRRFLLRLLAESGDSLLAVFTLSRVTVDAVLTLSLWLSLDREDYRVIDSPLILVRPHCLSVVSREWLRVNTEPTKSGYRADGKLTESPYRPSV